MFEDEVNYSFENILNHISVCEKRFQKINSPQDFVNTEEGNTILDSIVARLQPIAENVKRIIKLKPAIEQKYPNIEWNKIVKFRDFISHHYEMLDYEVVYDICKTNLPQRKTSCLIRTKSIKKLTVDI